MMRVGNLTISSVLQDPRVWLLLGFMLSLVGLCRNTFIYYYPSSVSSLVSNVSFPIAAICFCFSGIILFRRERLWLRATPGHRGRILIWVALCLVALLYGLLRGNYMVYVVKEFLWLLIFTVFLMIGLCDRIWGPIVKCITVMFYISAILMLFTIDKINPVAELLGGVQNVDGTRYTNSLAIGFRAYISTGLFIALWGAVSRRDGAWNFFMIGALFVQVALNVLLFKFRSEALFGVVAVASLLLLRPVYERKIRIGLSAFFVVLSIAGVVLLVSTDTFAQFLERARYSTIDEGMFYSRNMELSWYLNDLGGEVFIGRGVGGAFDGFGMIRADETSSLWKTLHYGALVFTLKGGILLILSFLSFIIVGLRFFPQWWYQNPRNMVAALYLPLLLILFSMLPIALLPEQGCRAAIYGMILSRFSCKW